MPTMKLTDKLVSNAKAPKSDRLELWDSLLPGFGLRITDKDARSWFVMYRAGEKRKQRRLKIGDGRIMRLGEARETARDALRKVAHGIDPAQDKSSTTNLAAGGTVPAVAADYLERYVKKHTRPGTFKETKRTFDVDVLPAWGTRPIGSITRRDVGALLDAIAGRGAAVQANRTLTRLKTFFRWLTDEEVIAESPIARMKPVTRETSRDRVLSEDEIVWFWSACDEIGWPFGLLFKLLLVTAQRRDEVGTITFDELDFERRQWTIPREKAKNDRAHEVALSDRALAIIAELQEQRGRIAELKGCQFLFSTNGQTPVSGFSRAKIRLDESMERLARKARGLPEGDAAYRKAFKLKDGKDLPRLIPEFIIHDLRRTAATNLARLNVPPHVTDKVLNHVSGTVRGVAAVYNRHAYIDERRDALEAWGRHVDNLLVSRSRVIAPVRP
jgi:integrase